MGKRLLVTRLLSVFGGGYINRMRNRNTLIIFNYHRIHSHVEKIPIYDKGVYGPNVDVFREQMKYLKSNFTIIGEAEIISFTRGDFFERGPYAAVTFDDAYKDNYDLALPVLKEFNIPAIYFVPVQMIQDRTLGWWDQAAFIINNSPKKTLTIKGKELSLLNRNEAINTIFSMFKNYPADRTKNLTDELAIEADFPSPNPEQMSNELMTWDELLEAQKAGITIGSHTCSHRVLSTLSEQEQKWEISHSKDFLENHFNCPVKSLAYPVGGLDCFSETTMKIAEQTKYKLAFSFNLT